jgi:ABC-type nickel/cobalt efflux system permease component RcnA
MWRGTGFEVAGTPALLSHVAEFVLVLGIAVIAIVFGLRSQLSPNRERRPMNDHDYAHEHERMLPFSEEVL